jgi:hypothetical protein
MLTPPSSSPPIPKPQPPEISKLAKAFVDSLTPAKVSDFLTWMLHYDIVELPPSSNAWYTHLNSMEIRGWIALGEYLSNLRDTGTTSHGFDIVVLDSICDRLHLTRSTVHGLLIHFSSAEAMKYGTLATTFHAGKSSVESLEKVQEHLHALHSLAGKLSPTENSTFTVWLPIIRKRLRGYLHLVIGPRIAQLRAGKPLLLASTNDNLPKEARDGFDMAFLWEIMLQERRVPLQHYGISGNDEQQSHDTSPFSPLSSPSLPSSSPDEETQRARNLSIKMMVENRHLRAKLEEVENKMRILGEANEKLTEEVQLLIQSAPAHGHFEQVKTPMSPLSTPPRPDARLQTTRQRHNSAAAAERPHTNNDVDATPSPRLRKHTRQQSQLISSSSRPFEGLSLEDADEPSMSPSSTLRFSRSHAHAPHFQTAPDSQNMRQTTNKTENDNHNETPNSTLVSAPTQQHIAFGPLPQRPVFSADVVRGTKLSQGQRRSRRSGMVFDTHAQRELARLRDTLGDSEL